MDTTQPTFKSLLILLRAVCLQSVFCLVLTLPCPFSVVQFTRPLNLTLVLFPEKLRLAHCGGRPLPVGIARTGWPPRGKVLHPNSSSERILRSTLQPTNQPSSLHRTLFPTLPSGKVPNSCRFHLAEILFCNQSLFLTGRSIILQGLP